MTAQDAMRTHYDSHANQHQSAEEARLPTPRPPSLWMTPLSSHTCRICMTTNSAMSKRSKSDAGHALPLQAHEARRSGGAFQLKKFHNDIKRALIKR